MNAGLLHQLVGDHLDAPCRCNAVTFNTQRKFCWVKNIPNDHVLNEDPYGESYRLCPVNDGDPTPVEPPSEAPKDPSGDGPSDAPSEDNSNGEGLSIDGLLQCTVPCSEDEKVRCSC